MITTESFVRAYRWERGLVDRSGHHNIMMGWFSIILIMIVSPTIMMDRGCS